MDKREASKNQNHQKAPQLNRYRSEEALGSYMYMVLTQFQTPYELRIKHPIPTDSEQKPHPKTKARPAPNPPSERLIALTNQLIGPTNAPTPLKHPQTPSLHNLRRQKLIQSQNP
jgi:hypothetical protein